MHLNRAGLLAVGGHCRYALVGLEQTAESTCLPEFKFPSKTVSVFAWQLKPLGYCACSFHICQPSRQGPVRIRRVLKHALHRC
jgi:hypothetical protein